jgi:regulatory protein YycI of two-component signal transduction system YycFG
MSKNLIGILAILVLIFGSISYLMFTENKDLKEDIETLTIEKNLLTEERDTLKTEMETMIPVSEKNALKLVDAYIWENGQKITGTRSYSFHPYSPTYKVTDKGTFYEIEVLRGIGKLEGNNLTVSYHALIFEVSKNTGEVTYKGMADSGFPNTVYIRVS